MQRITAPALLMLAAALCVVLPGDRSSRAADAARPATGTIKGTVKFSDGSIAASVKVELYDVKALAEKQPAMSLADKPAGNKPPPAVASTTTDANGKYTLDKVPPGKYRLQAGDQMKGMVFSQVTVEASKTATQDLTIRKRRRPGIGQ